MFLMKETGQMGNAMENSNANNKMVRSELAYGKMAKRSNGWIEINIE